MVDASRSRLYVYENRAGLPLRVADFYVTIGKAGAASRRRATTARRSASTRFQASSHRSELTDFYGSGAFTLSYPNEWDTRQGRNGHGIWIHGSPSNTYSRAPRASEGCVVLANDDLTRLGQYIKTGKTPVIIAEQDRVGGARSARARAATIWQPRSTNGGRTGKAATPRACSATTAHRSAAARRICRPLAASKQKVNAAKSWIKVGLSNVSLMLYPERSRFRAGELRAGLPEQQPQRPHRQTPVLEPRKRPLENYSRNLSLGLHHGQAAHQSRHHHPRTRRREGTENGRKLSAIRARRLLRRHDFPSRDRRLHDPGRRLRARHDAKAHPRPDRERSRQRPEERGLHRRHGAHHRPQFGHRAVLHQRRQQQLPQLTPRPPRRATATPCSARWSKAWTWSTRSRR